jgi:hypothetical protein
MPIYVETESEYSRGMRTGLEQAWKLAGNIVSLPGYVKEKLYGAMYDEQIFRMFTVKEAKKILDDYNQKTAKYNTILEAIENMDMSEVELKEFLNQLHEKYD